MKILNEQNKEGWSMTEFGRWLGQSNGDEMLSTVLRNDCTKEQARAAITNYCIIFGINVDTKEWDDLIRWAYDTYNCWFNNYNEFDNFMCADLV